MANTYNREAKLKDKFQTMETLKTPNGARILAIWLLVLGGMLLVIIFLPWQQNINGYGKLTALTPEDRPQTVQSAIPGRIVAWRVSEGQEVQKGDTLMVIAEVKDDYFDPNLQKRIAEQLVAKQQGIIATQAQIDATERQIVALTEGLKFSVQKAKNKVKQSRLKVAADSADFVNEQVQLGFSDKQYQRYENLYKTNGLISLTDLEKRKQGLQDKQAKYTSQDNKLLTSRNENINATIELNSINADYTDKISKAQVELNAKKAYLADAESELSKLKNKAANISVRIGQYCVIAPQTGVVVKALRAGIGETIKEGEALISIQPQYPKLAVELYVAANDVPLLQRGRRVRIQFNGWPAIQFTGWPQVSVGTFGGTVAVIDAVNSVDGSYRILVVPDSNSIEKWPTQLRMGGGALGWVMLDDVPIWFEVWRQLNGFPPSLSQIPAPTTGMVKDGYGSDPSSKGDKGGK